MFEFLLPLKHIVFHKPRLVDFFLFLPLLEQRLLQEVLIDFVPAIEKTFSGNSGVPMRDPGIKFGVIVPGVVTSIFLGIVQMPDTLLFLHHPRLLSLLVLLDSLTMQHVAQVVHS